MSTRNSQPRSRNRSKGKHTATGLPLESASPALPPSEDSVGGQGEEDGSEVGDASIASSVGPEEAVTPAPSASSRKKRARLDSIDPSTPASASAALDDVRSSTGGDPSTKIRIPYSKLRGSGLLNSPLFQSPDANGDVTKLKVTYSKAGQSPERTGMLRLDFPELSDYPATARALSAVGKGDQYGTVAKREIEALRDEFERIRVELRNFDLEARRELDVMAETRNGPGLPDPRSSPAMQRRRTEDVKPIRQSSANVSAATAATNAVIDPNKKRLKKLSSSTRGRDEEESESIDVLDLDAKSKAKREQRKRDKDGQEAPAAAGGGAGESKKYNLKKRQDNKKTKVKKAGDEEEAEAESGEDAESLDAANLPSTSGAHANPFWAFVHQFIREFVEDDLLTLQSRPLSSHDAAFLLPSLGRHWTEFRKPKSDDADGGAGEGENEVQPVHCGDLTQRILASLIENHLLPEQMLGVEPSGSGAAAPAGTPSAPALNSSASALPSSAPSPSAASIASVPLSSAAVVGSAPASQSSGSANSAQQYDATAFEFPETDAALPLSASPVSDYSFATMLSLEERIKMELKALGLFEPEDNPLNPAQEKEEDNEIVQEIRVLQNQLREQVAKNNSSREKIFELAIARLSEQKKDREVRGAHGELEKAYIRVMQKRKPKRKKGPGRKSGGA